MADLICSRDLFRWWKNPGFFSDFQKMQFRGFNVTGHFQDEGFFYFSHRDPFVVDDIVYPRAGESGYQGPMFSFKHENNNTAWSRAHVSSKYEFRMLKCAREWKDLEWDPTIRL